MLILVCLLLLLVLWVAIVIGPWGWAAIIIFLLYVMGGGLEDRPQHHTPKPNHIIQTEHRT